MEREAFYKAVEAVKRLRNKVDMPTERVTLPDVVDAIVEVTNVTGRFRGRPLIVKEVRRRILREAGVRFRRQSN